MSFVDPEPAQSVGMLVVATLLGTTPLWMAILSDTGATVLVTANALRLLGMRADRRHSYWRSS